MTSIHNKPKVNKADYMFQNKSNEHDLIKNPGQIDGLMFKIKELHNCTVHIYDHLSQVSFSFKFNLMFDYRV